jgi:hypothetical protein
LVVGWTIYKGVDKQRVGSIRPVLLRGGRIAQRVKGRDARRATSGLCRMCGDWELARSVYKVWKVGWGLEQGRIVVVEVDWSIRFTPPLH